MMAVVAYSTAPPSANSLDCRFISSFCNPTSLFSVAFPAHRRPITVASHLCTQETLTIDKSAFNLAEAVSEDQLWATACLRVSSFHDFQHTFAKEDHKRYLAEREFEALKERVAGKREGFRRVSCINATVPLSQIATISDDLCSECKFSDNGEDRVVVGTLDLNQCLRLPDEIIGMKPKGIGADFARAYLSNVCVAKELHRNGLGYALVAKSKMVAENWGISDLYVHVAVNNEPAKNLYMKSGFIYENDEPAWQARFLDRPRRILLWFGLPHTYDF
ncbi:GCN5-related N-acetyltransferase 7, chloroplastic isoform X1 [Cornus florida]|uniref:GCN5-related N-acetyltransferase 7, chloroplastic isoform X1 n=1 Tax=Cornus florida TaxID=4283 RepID=UPI0028989609|nr:GCN5-related N-acetyltransferase 7, chloroplastic isoform X1 [Cornus florida]